MPRRVPAILIAGTSSGVGKTTITTGIIGALVARGLAVQPFKVGPDYMDPSSPSCASGRPCRNLDSWMVAADVLVELYTRATAGADLAVVEGVMGLFDGNRGSLATGSSAEVAKLLGLPVLLVINVGKMAQSAAAVAFGYSRLDTQVNVAGVIANNVGSPGHLTMVRKAIETRAGIPVVGHMPKRDDLRLPERHLGLIPTAEGRVGSDFYARLVRQVEDTINLDAIVSLAKHATPVPTGPTGIFPSRTVEQVATIAVAQD